MATIREGNQRALVIVDLQVGVIASAWKATDVVANAALAVERARAAGVPVVWVQHSDEELAYGSPEWAWAPGLTPAEGESVVHKRFNSAFEDTDLSDVLERLGISHVTLAGAATNWCIRATAFGALDRGYDLTLVKDAHTTESIEFEDGTTIPAENIVNELNVGLRWVAYPGRTSTTAKAAELEFAATS